MEEVVVTGLGEHGTESSVLHVSAQGSCGQGRSVKERNRNSGLLIARIVLGISIVEVVEVYADNYNRLVTH